MPAGPQIEILLEIRSKVGFWFNVLRSTIIASDTRRWINVGLTLVQRLRRWINVKPTLFQRLVSAELIVFPAQTEDADPI